MTATFQRTGGYTPSEVHSVMTASNYRPSMAGRAIIYCHGLGGNGFVDGADIRADLAQYANRGFVISAPLLGGGTTWGNPASAGSTIAVDGVNVASAVDAVLTYLGTAYGADVTRPLFIADSHGAPILLNWAVRNPVRFGGGVMRVPAISLQTLHDTNPIGLAAGMETAYGGLGALVAAYPTRDALHPTFIANLLSLGIVDRLRLMYNQLDNIIDPVPIQQFAAATGVEAIEMGGPDHAPWGLFDVSDQYRWLTTRT